MDYNSETESDSSYSPSTHPCFQMLSVDDTFLIWDPRHPHWSTEQPLLLHDIRREIYILLEQDTSHFVEATDIADGVLFSSASLLNFLACVPRLLTDETNIPGILTAFSALVSPQFIERLFEYRRIFRSAAKNIPGNSMSDTWVDVFLARLSHLVGSLASGITVVQYPGPTLLESLESQKQDDSIRATSQLPENWHDLKSVIGSHNFSPAAKRITLSLFFAAYVMGPQLTSAGSLQQPRPPPADILDSLFIAASQLSSQMQSPSMSLDCSHQRMTMAMLISLVSVIDCVVDVNANALRPSQLRPEGLDHLLDLIWIVIGPEADLFLPLEELDLPHIILLRWGNTVPWSWSTWTDERNANTEYLRSITATWLYHINRPLYSALSLSENEKLFGVDLQGCLFTDSAASSFVILQLLHSTLSKLSQEDLHKSISHSTLLGLLGKLCWATVQFLEMNRIKIHPAIQSRIPEYARCLLTLFCFLGPSEEEIFVQGLIIEALTLVPPRELSSSLQSILRNKPVQFVRRLDQATRSRARALSDSSRGTMGHFSALNATKSLLDFLTIILLQDDERNVTIHGIASFYLGLLFKLLRSPGRDCSEVVAPHLMMAFPHEDVCTLAIHVGDRKLTTAAAFAHYLLIGDRLCEGLLCHEVWDFLLSNFAAIVDRDILKEKVPLALLICTAVCAALRKLICSFTSPIRQSILSSPWTVSMRMALWSIFEDETYHLPYFEELKLKLGKIGKSLLKLTLTESDDSPDGQTSEIDISSNERLLYYGDDSYCGLLLTCD